MRLLQPQIYEGLMLLGFKIFGGQDVHQWNCSGSIGSCCIHSPADEASRQFDIFCNMMFLVKTTKKNM